MTSLSPDAGAQRSVALHRGIEYPGEVVRAARWSDALGAQLQGDSYFHWVGPPVPKTLALSMSSGGLARTWSPWVVVRQALAEQNRRLSGILIHRLV